MLVCIYPDLGNENFYMRNLVDSLNDEFEFIDFRSLIRNPFLFFKIKVFHFNWIENEISENFLVSKFQYYIKKMFISLSKKLGKKIIWTFHNKKPHDTNEKEYINNFINFMMDISDNIIVHCKESFEYLKGYENKIVYMPHGNYIGNYKINSSDLRENFNIKSNELVFMFIGQIKKYKNIEILIEAFNKANISNSKLIIAGNCKSLEYRKKLREQVSSDNIIFSFKFIENEEITKYLNTADILVFPYDIKSTLNSGSIIMSFSYKKTVISPLIGTLKDIKENFYYSYKYNTEEDHLINLMKKIEEVYTKYNENNNILNYYGLESYNYVKEKNSWLISRNKIKKIYYK